MPEWTRPEDYEVKTMLGLDSEYKIIKLGSFRIDPGAWENDSLREASLREARFAMKNSGVEKFIFVEASEDGSPKYYSVED